MSKVQNESNNVVKRGLKDRHISMIAIGGCIGTGLFVTSGGAIHDAGALGACNRIRNYRNNGIFLNDVTWRNGYLFASIRLI